MNPRLGVWVLRSMVGTVVVLCLPFLLALYVAEPLLLVPTVAGIVAFMASRRRARTVSSRAARRAAAAVPGADARRRPDPAWRVRWAATEVERYGYVIPWAYPPGPDGVVEFHPGYVGITSQRTYQRPDGTWWSDRWDQPDHEAKRRHFALDYDRAHVVSLGVLTETAAEQTWELPLIAQLCGEGHQLLNVIGNPRPWR